MKLWCTCQIRFGRTISHGQSTAEKKPSTREKATRRCQNKSREQRRDKEDDRVLRHDAKAGEGGNPEPPALVFAVEQANDPIGCEHPAELLEGGVLKLRTFEQRDGSERNSERGDGYRNAVASERSCDETGRDDDAGLREN